MDSYRISDFLEELIGFDAGGAHPHVHRHHLVRGQIPGQFHHHLDLSSSSAGPLCNEIFNQSFNIQTHSTHIPHMEDHGGACLSFLILAFLHSWRHVAALIQDCKACGLWSLHSFYETSTVFFGNEHLTEQKPETSMRLDT